jgi:spermidine synthase
MVTGLAINFTIAALSVVAVKLRPAPPPKLKQRLVHGSIEPVERVGTPPVWVAAGVFAISGFCALGFEVIWTKVLTLVLGPTTYAFSLVLCAFISGLALGGMFFSRWSRALAKPWHMLATTQALAAFSAVWLSQKMGDSIPFIQRVHLLYYNDFHMFLLQKAILVFVLLLPPTFFFGSALPLVVSACRVETQNAGRSVGWLYGVNTLGAVLGAWVAGFFLIPFLGKETGIKFLVVLQSLAALALLWMIQRRQPSQRNLFPLLIALIALGTGLFLPRWDRTLLARANLMIRHEELAGLGWLEAFFSSHFPPQSRFSGDQGRMLFSGDAMEGFAAVWADSNLLGREQRSLFLSGKADASTDADMFTQALLAHFPLSMRPDAKRVMVLGLASGITAAEVLSHPGIRNVDVLEINPQVLEAARFFSSWNHNILEDPRVRFLIQDAKTHLLFSPEKYDVIISEPSNPWMAGLSELFTQEFYRRAWERLTPGGVLVQFIHSYQMDWDNFALVGRTFNSVFDNGLLVRTLPDDRPVNGRASDYLLVGIKGSEPFSISSAPGTIVSQNVDLPEPSTLSRMVVAQNLGALFGNGEVHTDDRPVLEFRAPRLMFTFASAAIESELARRAGLDSGLHITADKARTDPRLQVAFALYALSVDKPFPGMVDYASLPSDLQESYALKVEHYCAEHVIEDFSPFVPEILRIRCSMNQMAVLNRALPNSRHRAGIFLSMAHVCMTNGVLTNAIRYFRMAAQEAPGTELANFALNMADELTSSMQDSSLTASPK